MMSLTTCRKIIAETTISDEYFLRLHFCIEALFKRLFLIGLRKQGVQYLVAVKIVDSYFETSKDFHKRIFKYCEIDHKELSEFGNYAELEALFIDYTSYMRNMRVHGVSGPYDKEDLTLLIEVDKRYVQEIESFFMETKRLSLFDKPGKWGAKKGTEKDTQNIYQELCKKLHKKHYTREDVKGILKAHKQAPKNRSSPRLSARTPCPR